MKQTVNIAGFCGLIFIALGLASCQKNEPRRWTTYVSDDQRFSINIPHGYKSFMESEQTAFGEISCFYLYWRTPESAIAAMDIKLMELSYIDVSAALKRFTKDQLLDSAVSFFNERQYAIKSRGRVLEYIEAGLDSFPGRYLVACEDVNKADSLIVFVKAGLVGNRLYMVKANGYKTSINKVVVDSFMNSFQSLGLPAKPNSIPLR